jgi:hypothetical protein
MAFSFVNQYGQPNVQKNNFAQNYDPASNDVVGRRQIQATDVGFQLPTREAARMAIQGSMSNQNPEDAAANDAIRSAFGERLQALQGNQAQQKSQMESDLAQGFQNQAAELRRQSGGTGTYGSSTYGSQVGDLAGQYQNARAKALIDLQNNGLSQLQGVQQGLGDVYGQNLGERQFQLGQGQALANLLTTQVGQDQARESGLMQKDLAEQAQRNALIESIMGTAGQAGGAYLGYKAGTAGKK